MANKIKTLADFYDNIAEVNPAEALNHLMDLLERSKIMVYGISIMPSALRNMRKELKKRGFSIPELQLSDDDLRKSVAGSADLVLEAFKAGFAAAKVDNLDQPAPPTDADRDRLDAIRYTNVMAMLEEINKAVVGGHERSDFDADKLDAISDNVAEILGLMRPEAESGQSAGFTAGVDHAAPGADETIHAVCVDDRLYILPGEVKQIVIELHEQINGMKETISQQLSVIRDREQRLEDIMRLSS